MSTNNDNTDWGAGQIRLRLGENRITKLRMASEALGLSMSSVSKMLMDKYLEQLLMDNGLTCDGIDEVLRIE